MAAVKQDSLTLNIIAAGMAAVGTVTFTNPIEIVKTRMSLQGELIDSKDFKVKPFKNPIQALYVIAQQEGIRGVQKGLMVAYVYQILLNCSRLGLYEPTRLYCNKRLFPNKDEQKYQNIHVNIFSGGITGALGAFISSPLYLVKTRMQAFASNSKSTSAGKEQTYYKNSIDGLKQIYQKENGIKGLFRGCGTSIIRTTAGSCMQLPLYYYIKNNLMRLFNYEDNDTKLQLLSSTLTGIGVGIFLNPFDVILVRVYNQKGNLYNGPIDCLLKTLKFEGPQALFKGMQASLMRFAPHTILMLTFMEKTTRFVYGFRDKMFK